MATISFTASTYINRTWLEDDDSYAGMYVDRIKIPDDIKNIMLNSCSTFTCTDIISSSDKINYFAQSGNNYILLYSSSPLIYPITITIDYFNWNNKVVSGTQGTCYWFVTDTGVLVINTGNLYWTESYPGWYAYREQIQEVAVVGDGEIECSDSINYCFCGCQIESLNLSKWNFNNISSLKGMFYGCDNLKEVAFNCPQSSVITMVDTMFYDCSSLEYVDMQGLNINATSIASMFFRCGNLKSINFGNNFYINEQCEMSGAFTNVSNLYNYKGLLSAQQGTYLRGTYTIKNNGRPIKFYRNNIIQADEFVEWVDDLPTTYQHTMFTDTGRVYCDEFFEVKFIDVEPKDPSTYLLTSIQQTKTAPLNDNVIYNAAEIISKIWHNSYINNYVILNVNHKYNFCTTIAGWFPNIPVILLKYKQDDIDFINSLDDIFYVCFKFVDTTDIRNNTLQFNNDNTIYCSEINELDDSVLINTHEELSNYTHNTLSLYSHNDIMYTDISTYVS